MILSVDFRNSEFIKLINLLCSQDIIKEVRDLIKFTKECETLAIAYNEKYNMYTGTIIKPVYPNLEKFLKTLKAYSPQAYQNFTDDMDVLNIIDYLACKNMDIVDSLDRIFSCQRYLAYLKYSIIRMIGLSIEEKVIIFSGLTLME